MREQLAERLLAKVMGWNAEDAARELPVLQAMAAVKYDEYHQFSPGMRFVESLALWLQQMETPDDRRRAYEYVRSHLVFISQAEMSHFVAITFPDFIRPILMKRVAEKLGLRDHNIAQILTSNEYRILCRRCLFLGLSDGAHIDLFRRSNSELSNEQVWSTYDLSHDKADSMLRDLREDLNTILGEPPSDDMCTFSSVFLLDDFAGSGISYFRKDAEALGGKMHRVLSNLGTQQPIGKLTTPSELSVYVILYVATGQALDYLRDAIKKWDAASVVRMSCKFRVVQLLPGDLQFRPDTDKDLALLCEKHFDKGIIDKHYLKGKTERPYLGFDQCALPVVLAHNTPNNSLPLLWSEEHRSFRGLFPRISRHGRQV